jgi:hypothetical protein
MAGGAGFVAGAVLVAGGLLSLAILTRSPAASQPAIHLAGCLLGLLPPLAAALAWPVLYFGAFMAGLLLIPLVLLACVAWAWVVSARVAGHLSALLGWERVGTVRGLVFTLEVLAILASWPAFTLLLYLCNAMGYKVGWS